MSAVVATTGVTAARALRAATARLVAAGVTEPRLSAELLLAHVLRSRRLEVVLDRDRALTVEEAAALAEGVARRSRHEPLQYVLGEAPFRRLTLRVGPGVLVPRPETECLVEAVLDRLRERGVAEPRVLDVGTGSGALALSLLDEMPGARAVATDVSEAALELAAVNAVAAGLSGRLELRRGDLLEPLRADDRFDAVVANLPYVAAGEWEGLPPEVRCFEPPEALLGGAAGDEVVARLVRATPPHVRPSGLLACEAAPGHAEGLRRLVEGTPGLRYIAAFRDLAGRVRGFLAESPASPQP